MTKYKVRPWEKRKKAQERFLRNPCETIYKRLLSREGTDDYGNTEVGRQRILSHKDEFEEKMIDAGVIGLNADSNSKEVALVLIDTVG